MRLRWLVLSIVGTANAAVTLPSVIGDHMVLQRDLPIRIWGKADRNEPVTVRFQGSSARALPDSLGRWQVSLPPVSAGGPYTLEIQGQNRIVFNDVLVGDVWLASGQSNMEFPVRNAIHAEEELAAAKHPRIRLFHVSKAAADYPKEDVAAKPWTLCNSESVSGFSAVAYFFARDLQKTQDIPIGLIEADWGGTPVESWTSLRALASDASLMPVFAARAQVVEQEAATRMIQSQEPEPKKFHPDFAAWAPGALFNAMIAPLVPFRIKGALWYQGESNAGADRVGTYRQQFEAMIRDWRERWAEGDFPFYFVQLANFKTGAKWPELREAQRQTLELANTGMALAIDIGTPDDIHPKNKQEVGRRLALIARSRLYGEPVEESGPVFRQAIPESGALRLMFGHAEGLNSPGDLKGFEIAGEDKKFAPAKARIEGNAVVISNPEIPEPIYARYDWANNPEGNLYNRANLPAAPFTGSR